LKIILTAMARSHRRRRLDIVDYGGRHIGPDLNIILPIRTYFVSKPQILVTQLIALHPDLLHLLNSPKTTSLMVVVRRNAYKKTGDENT